MNCLIAALRGHRSTIGASFAVDPIIDFPLDYYLLSEIVEELAFDLAEQHTRARPVAVKLDHGLTQTLLDLALLEAEIPHLCLPKSFSRQQTAHALEANGAQALYAGTPCQVIKGNIDSEIVLPNDTARITYADEPISNPNGTCFTARHMVAMAEQVARSVRRNCGQRHLALLPPGNLAETISGLYSSILIGGTYVVPPREMVGLANPFRPDFTLMARMIADWRINSLILGPELLTGLIRVLEETRVNLPLLTIIEVNGTEIPPTLITSARALGLPVAESAKRAQLAW